MNKNWFQMTLKPLSPLHIGYFKYGMIAETRLFIPGWTIWGALVNATAKEEREYGIYQQWFREITCFYPVIIRDESENPIAEQMWIPVWSKGKRKYRKFGDQHGEIDEEEFRMHFIDSYISTSISSHTQTAVDGSLHEIEVILPRSKVNSKYRLYWRGYLGVQSEDLKLKVGQQIRVGGEAKYGLGRMSILQIDKVNSSELKGLVGRGRFATNPLIHYVAMDNLELKNEHLKQHEKERIVLEMDFSKNMPLIKEQQLCIVPGSEINLDLTSDSFELDRGVLKKR